MPSAELKIDTSVPAVTGQSSSPSSARSRSRIRDLATSSARLKHSVAAEAMQNRMRSASSASTASTLSVVSPAASSANGSSSSLHIPEPDVNPTAIAGPSSQSPVSPATSLGTPSPRTSSEYVLAMHDYDPQTADGTYLSFRAGQIIQVLNRDSSGWWDGQLEGNRGWFPSNYVTAHLNSLTEEVLPSRSPWQRGHKHTVSAVSATSWTSTPSPRHSRFGTNQASEFDSYCPPLMVPLLHGMSVLQGSVRSNRLSHFQPSTASIIVSVRSMLSSLDCLHREAPPLKRYPQLADERARVLSNLAALVAQTKKAGEEANDEEKTETETETMLKLAGQLFQGCRRFLAIATQCGIELPDPTSSSSENTVFSTGLGRNGGDSINRADANGGGTKGLKDVQIPTTNGIVNRFKTKQRPTTPRAAKSMSDLRNQQFSKNAFNAAEPVVPPASKRVGRSRTRSRGGSHRRRRSSASSVTSSSSFYSSESVASVPTFPTGPCSAAEVMEALRRTHDQYLSTIAAFIGHAHSHSRSSHASSTGHMYDLVREVVDMVCKLLTIVEAVMRHPDIPLNKTGNLRAAKEGLYKVTTSLADSVRLLTATASPAMTEEEEKAILLRSATDALKAGADCVAAVKMFFSRSALGDRQVIVYLPEIGESNAVFYSPDELSGLTQMKSLRLKSPSMSALQGHHLMDTEDEEDLTIQARTISTASDTPPKLGLDTSEELLNLSRPSLKDIDEGMVLETPISPEKTKPLPRVEAPLEPIPAGLPSPSVYSTSSRTEDDRTTWEGSEQQGEPSKALEDKLLNGDLPSIPPVELLGQDPTTWMLSHDYLLEDVAYNSEGTLVGGTLQALVEKMTPHDSLVDPTFSDVFWLTFRLFATPTELLNAIITRYNLVPPPNLSEEDVYVWQQRKGMPVRLRVSNFITKWLDEHWRASTDKVVLLSLSAFNRDALSSMFPGPSQRIQEFIVARRQDRELVNTRRDRFRDRTAISPPSAPPSDIPRPSMTKAVLAALRSKNFGSIVITDFDALELARQLTIMECNLYCAIRPEELLETGQGGGGTSPKNIKAVSSLSTAITGWVAESILNELDTKKRIGLVKYFIKVADRCTSLNNFSTSRSILAALDSSTISRLHQTWLGLPQKNRIQLESLRKLSDHARNYNEYRSRLRNTAPPAVPFLGLYLTDVTFCREGNPSHRTSPLAPDKKLLNFNKYHKLTRIVQDMERFQVPYNLKEIPEVREYLNEVFEKSKSKGDLQDLYRRSLLVEPKQPADNPPATANDVRQLFNWALRSQSQSQQPTPAS